jgi:NAD(P)-dependent dehydrogenase (short-subunit alcohol dehydrogenase family)
MARELGEHGIRVNAIGPGPIDTPISQRFRELSEQGVVFHRLGEPEEVGRAVTFLASEMSSFVTGTILYVDGGYML